MQMTWRWYGRGNDDITLDHIKQIPGVDGIVWSLHDKTAGEEWEEKRINDEVAYIRSKGFNADVVESVNVHDDIKIGNAGRDTYIDIYIDTIAKLSRAGVKVICYNFMPVFDWTRTDLYKRMEDGSNALFFEKKLVDGVAPQEIVDRILNGAGEKTMPGWEPERLSKLENLFAAYKDVTDEVLTENYKYFLQKIIPACEKYGVKMAVHPDDPPFPIFGLPRIVRSAEHIQKVLDLVNSPFHGLTLCTGSLGSSLQNNTPEMVRRFAKRIHFMHVRNVKVFDNGDFIECSHRACDGSVDTVEVMRALHETGFTGYVRPDHGRHLWGEEKTCRPGYGLYDRALGVMYLLGVWDTITHKTNGEKK